MYSDEHLLQKYMIISNDLMQHVMNGKFQSFMGYYK